MQGGNLNDPAAVKSQYATSDGLDIRITFHDRYSTNRLGFANWLVSNYDIREGMNVLELGCGTGSIWKDHDDLIRKAGKLVLTDLSEGMVDKAKETLGQKDNVVYDVADIQDLSYDNNSFDVVIANSMLYHVPDIKKAVKEVRRVLKEGGTFYCSTLGENNFTDHLAQWFALGGEDFRPNHNFTLQNGTKILSEAFKDVTSLIYEDSLHITSPEDLVAYLKSLTSFKAVMDLPEDRIRQILAGHESDGAIDLPKEYGTFICR